MTKSRPGKVDQGRAIAGALLSGGDLANHAHQVGCCASHFSCASASQIALLEDYARQAGVAGSKRSCICALS